MMHIAVGSNIDPELHVPAAIQHLDDAYGAAAASPFLQVPAIDRPEQSDYWNGVVAIRDEATIEGLRAIEAAEGRQRVADKWAARTLDLDILLHDGHIVDEDLHRRPFLAHCLANLEALPPGITDPGPQWPIVWNPED
jgi:2-amino-4-hydroxy-6-hydroxymethyldihydropteridine diphosphokinase